jgi:hypothetical protein
MKPLGNDKDEEVPFGDKSLYFLRASISPKPCNDYSAVCLYKWHFMHLFPTLHNTSTENSYFLTTPKSTGFTNDTSTSIPAQLF